MLFFFEGDGDHRDLHVLTHSFPTRRSSDLRYGIGAEDWELARRGLIDPEQPTTGFKGLREVEGAAGVEMGDNGRKYFTRSEEHTSELQSLMRNSYAVFCLNKKKYATTYNHHAHNTRPMTTHQYKSST